MKILSCIFHAYLISRAHAGIMRTSASMNEATIVIPTRNEAENIGPLIERISAACPASEILVIDDASPDGTAQRARELGLRYPVRVIERTGERGLSSAVLRGILEARTGLVVVMDADFSHPPEAIPALVRAVREGADLAVGSRYVLGGAVEGWPFLRRLISKAGTLLARPLTSVRDPMSGFFCLRRDLLEGIDLRPQGFKILLEILARARPRRVVEIPIRFQDRAHGTSKFGRQERRDFLRQIWTLYRDLHVMPLDLRPAVFPCPSRHR